MRTAFGYFGEPTEPPPFPQPPLPQWQDRTSDIPTTADVGMVNVGQARRTYYEGPSIDPFSGESTYVPIAPPSSGIPWWVFVGAGVVGLGVALTFAGRR